MLFLVSSQNIVCFAKVNHVISSLFNQYTLPPTPPPLSLSLSQAGSLPLCCQFLFISYRYSTSLSLSLSLSLCVYMGFANFYSIFFLDFNMGFVKKIWMILGCGDDISLLFLAEWVLLFYFLFYLFTFKWWWWFDDVGFAFVLNLDMPECVLWYSYDWWWWCWWHYLKFYIFARKQCITRNSFGCLCN